MSADLRIEKLKRPWFEFTKIGEIELESFVAV